jgi:propanol-preferring alcohol dehydrogenase
MASLDIPKQQEAARPPGFRRQHHSAYPKVDVPSPAPGQILVKINWSGLCASDKSLIHDEWAAFGVSMTKAAKGIAGHEGAGVVVAVGDDMNHRWKIGDRAGIKWVASVCGACEFCTNGQDELHCPKQTNSGFTAAGTFQQYCLADGKYTTRIPEGVKDEEAGRWRFAMFSLTHCLDF